jgi:hypothetical protein
MRLRGDGEFTGADNFGGAVEDGAEVHECSGRACGALADGVADAVAVEAKDGMVQGDHRAFYSCGHICGPADENVVGGWELRCVARRWQKAGNVFMSGWRVVIRDDGAFQVRGPRALGESIWAAHVPFSYPAKRERRPQPGAGGRVSTGHRIQRPMRTMDCIEPGSNRPHRCGGIGRTYI